MPEEPQTDWQRWFRLTPAERWRETEKLWVQYLAMGGSLDPEPDPQSPFHCPELYDPIPADQRPKLRVTWPRGVERIEPDEK